MSKMCLNFAANSFVFGCKNRENAPRTFSVNLARQKLPRCVWTSQKTTSLQDTYIVTLRPELFSVNFAGRELPKCIWTSQQTASFLDAKMVKMRSELFYQAGKAKASKSHLNSTANRFVFGHINRKSWNCTQNFYCKHCKQRTSKMHLNPTANSFTFGRKKSRKWAQNLFFYLQSENLHNAPGLHGKQLRFCSQKSWKCTQNIFVNLGGG